MSVSLGSCSDIVGSTAENFDHVDYDFPVSRPRSIAENFRDRILADAEMENLWWKQSYAEKQNLDRFHERSGKITSDVSEGRPEGGFFGLARAVALIAVAAGAVGSLGLMFRASQRTPRFLLVLFVFWVLSPFVALAWANVVSKRWSVLTRATLYGVTIVITLGSLAVYGKLVLPPAGSPRAFVFVAVPPASWLLMAIVVSMAAWISRRRSQRSSGA